MKILFTGASSFTGFWFVRELARAGHAVTATFRRSDAAAYDGVRGERVRLLQSDCERIFGCSFGDERFLQLVRDGGPWDVLCHHAADVTNYKSPDFDVAAAVANNTRNLPEILEALAAGGCGKMAITGSVFEGGEGAGSDGLPHFSPYGLSKALTSEMVRFYAERAGLRLGKFVIPNPFGPYEEPRFTAYLMRTWFAGETATVRTPAYVRDNIHVSLLARAYAGFVAALPPQPGFEKLNPSGYVETQGRFAQRFAAEMRPRLNLPCNLELTYQAAFPEPRTRINTHPTNAGPSEWDESAAWDAVAQWYQQQAQQAVS